MGACLPGGSTPQGCRAQQKGRTELQGDFLSSSEKLQGQDNLCYE